MAASGPTATAANRRFTAESLPLAIGNLFKINNYDVEYDFHLHGAQVDLVAKAKGDPLSTAIFIEATVEYVSNDKYAKDITKFALIQRKDPAARCLLISSLGFTGSVKERARETGIILFTYDELFSKFERFSPYVDSVLGDKDTKKLVDTYEEPLFHDSKGTDYATKWLAHWKGFAPDEAKWLIVLGEYGTGKTALTRVLQFRWVEEYHSNPTKPLPVRIELRTFSRQFDARGLLHHFLDTNGLSHVPVDFMTHLIREGRVVLLLDGYDEMAQYLNARERRACLSALAELAAEGAKGILTSRPNYFTESEELSVFEALYSSIEQNRYHLSQVDKSYLDQERQVDELVERYVLQRYERYLQDLTPEQTESLVRRNLVKDPRKQELVISILRRVFRGDPEGNRQALSGKPVIITYLLEITDELRVSENRDEEKTFTEWQVYKLIVDRLMLRDLRRSSLPPPDRRNALQKLAVVLSGRDTSIADESVFHSIIEEEFRGELRRLQPDERRARKNELFEDLRSSATLTRAHGPRGDGWVFSHNSLREYLAAELFLARLMARTPISITTPITSAMRSFVSSLAQSEIDTLWQALSELWPSRGPTMPLGPYLVLLWDAARRRERGIRASLLELATDHGGDTAHIDGIALRDLNFASDLGQGRFRVDGANTEFTDVSFEGMDLSGSRFSQSVLDSVSFRGANLVDAIFESSLLFECDFSDAVVAGADFRSVDLDSVIFVPDKDGLLWPLGSKSAIGYLRYRGALTSQVDDYYIFQHHPRFPIVEKICERVSEQRNSQLRGLTQRGEARTDPRFARELVDRMVSAGWVEIDRHDLVSATPIGRTKLGQIAHRETLPKELAEFLAEWK